MRLANFAIGPIIIGISLDLGIGLPIKTQFEMDCEVSYSTYIAGLAKANVSVGVDYGIRWKRKWFIRVPYPFIDWLGSANAYADAICYFSQNFTDSDFNLNKLGLQFSIEPYVNAGLRMSVATVVHASCGIKFGAKGYVNFGYYKPYLKGTYGLNDTSTIYANVFLGLKNIKFLGLSIPNLGYSWDWELLKFDKTVIPETSLFEVKIN